MHNYVLLYNRFVVHDNIINIVFKQIREYIMSTLFIPNYYNPGLSVSYLLQFYMSLYLQIWSTKSDHPTQANYIQLYTVYSV